MRWMNASQAFSGMYVHGAPDDNRIQQNEENLWQDKD